jgi:MYXO-CTERM domain-containing protein
MASLRSVQLTICLASLVAAAPSTAEACSLDPCFSEFVWLDGVAPINADAVANDGVLVLQATQGDQQTIGEFAAALTLSVTREGQPVPGTLEDTAVSGVLIWRPGEPLLAGATYDVAGSFTNNAEVVEFGCAAADIPLAFQFSAVDPTEPLAAPTVAAEAAAIILESNEITDLVCCDGAFPGELECGGSGVYWTEGACAADKGLGVLDLQVTATSPLAPATAAMLATVIRVDGQEVYRGLAPQHSLRSNAPVCIVVEQVHLGTGDVIAAAEQCHGDDLVDELGPQVLDPAVVLAAQCTGPLYTCELVDEGFPAMWDETKCTDLDPPPVDSEGEPTTDSEGQPTTDSEGQPTTSASEGDADSSGEPEGSSSGADTGEETDDSKQGCACNSGAPDPAGLLGLVVLAALARRRRR